MNYPPTRKPGDKLRIGGFTDGGSYGAPAVSVERAEGGGVCGLSHSQEVLNEMVHGS